MPYRRSYRKRGRTMRRRTYRRKRVTLRKTARKVRRLNQAIERKVYIVQHAGSINTVPLRFQPAEVVQGVANQQRLGRSIFVTGLTWRYTLTASNTNVNGDQNCAIRMIIVLAKNEPTGVTSSFGDIFSNTETDGTPMPSFYAFKQRDVRTNYKILYDQIHRLGFAGSSNNGGGGIPSKSGRVYVPVNKKVQYLPSGTMTQNRLLMFVVDAYGVNTLGIDSYTQLYFTDS